MVHELENCPFCGSIHINLTGYLLTYRIECKECGASGPKRKTLTTAKEAWNHQSRELRFEKALENKQLLEHLNSFGSLPPPAEKAPKKSHSLAINSCSAATSLTDHKP